jgi:hypothetical protein
MGTIFFCRVDGLTTESVEKGLSTHGGRGFKSRYRQAITSRREMIQVAQPDRKGPSRQRLGPMIRSKSSRLCPERFRITSREDW